MWLKHSICISLEYFFNCIEPGRVQRAQHGLECMQCKGSANYLWMDTSLSTCIAQHTITSRSMHTKHSQHFSQLSIIKTVHYRIRRVKQKQNLAVGRYTYKSDFRDKNSNSKDANYTLKAWVQYSSKFLFLCHCPTSFQYNKKKQFDI